jgi:hypothetical protein
MSKQATHSSSVRRSSSANVFSKHSSSPALSSSRLSVALVAALMAVSVLGVRGSTAPHQVLLSADLLNHQARQTTARTRVIVHGSDAEIAALANRYNLQILKWLDGSAVLLANSAELKALSSEPSLDHLSGDVQVQSGMSVSNLAIAADQVRAGTGGLLGLGATNGVNCAPPGACEKGHRERELRHR